MGPSKYLLLAPLVSEWTKILLVERAWSLILFSLICLLVFRETRLGEQMYKKIWDIRPAGLLPSGLQMCLALGSICRGCLRGWEG